MAIPAMLQSGEYAVSNFRHMLWRVWDSSKPNVLWIMLNPSTADGIDDDKTLEKCINFSDLWKFGSLTVVNLFPYRATDFEELRQKSYEEIIGIENEKYIEMCAKKASQVVIAWGEKGIYHRKNREVVHILRKYHKKVVCLGFGTQKKQPKHPLFLPFNTTKRVRVCSSCWEAEGKGGQCICSPCRIQLGREMKHGNYL